MTGVPGGDVTLHAAITAEVAYQLPLLPAQTCAHVAERVLAVLAGRLPHTPPDRLATLIGGTVQTIESSDVQPYREHESRVVGPWVPDSPPETLRERVGRNLGSPVTDDEWDAYLAWVKAGRQRTAAPEPRQDTCPGRCLDAADVGVPEAGGMYAVDPNCPVHTSTLPAAPTEEPTPHA